MKILSFNCRGVGSRVKSSAIRKLVWEESVDMLFLQETKVSQVDSNLCSSLWGDCYFEWKALPAVNTAGGSCVFGENKLFLSLIVLQGLDIWVLLVSGVLRLILVWW